jgi:ATP-binding cassette subfamily B protein
MGDTLGASMDTRGEARLPTILQCLVIVGRRHGLNLTVPQIVKDNSLPDALASTAEAISCARRAGLKAKLVNLRWSDFSQLKGALPAIVILQSGASMVLLAFDGRAQTPHVLLQDPAAEEGAPLTVDQMRFEQACTGEVILLRRDNDISREEPPFGLGMIASQVFRERRLVRDLAISSFILSLMALAPILLFMGIMNYVLYYASTNTLLFISVAMLVLILFECIFVYVRSYLIQIIGARVDSRLSHFMFDKVLRLQMDFFERTQVGIIGHDMNQMWKVRQFITGQFFGTVLDSMMLLIFLPIMCYFSFLLTAIVFAFCGLIVIWLILMLPLSRTATRAVVDVEAERGAFLYQTIQGMRTVKSLALESRQRQRWDALIGKFGHLKMREGAVRGVIQAGVRPLERLAVVSPFALGIYIALSSADAAVAGSLYGFLMLSMRVAGPLMQMAQLVNQYDEVSAAVSVVGALVTQPREEGASDHGVRTPLSGRVEFLNLRFKYQGATTFALDGATFQVQVGQTLGVVGRSGSGKTTVARLLQRLHSDYEGLIKIDGVDVREYDDTHLRRSLGIVLQENFLFSGSIRSNICSSKPHATFDEVVRAARLAGAEEFIERLPGGYETFIYEGSPNLSGGQRQRLAIARALIVDPRILILDEATSALDPDSEAIVNENIRRIAKGRTVIVISHRLSSLVNSDAILVLERGKVADVGKHHELLDRCDIYANLWNQQNRHIADASQSALAQGPSRVS